jgi:ZIP family zinc transporter
LNLEIIRLGFTASLLAGLATGVGAIPILFFKQISDKLLDVMLGFAAGVMLAASSFSLIVPAINSGGVWVTVAGLAIGASTIHIIDRFAPHQHFIYGVEGPSSRLARLWLFIIAITIHNFPEGMAVGVSFGGGDVTRGIIIATAIGLQNMPEGLAVAFPLVRENYSRMKSLWYATLTGLVEPIGGFLGSALVSIIRPILPWGLAFAAGAMIFVVSDEMIPESHRKGFEREATFGLIIGFMIMMLLDNLLG